MTGSGRNVVEPHPGYVMQRRFVEKMPRTGTRSAELGVPDPVHRVSISYRR